jgi:hypothetical protein
MNNRQPSASLLKFLRLPNHGQNEAFNPRLKYKLEYREDIPLADSYIPHDINALVSIHPGSGFSIVEHSRVRSFQYTYLSACECQGVGFEQCRIEVGTHVIELEGRHLDRIVDLVTERHLMKLYLPANFEVPEQDSGPKEMTWVRGLTITTSEQE